MMFNSKVASVNKRKQNECQAENHPQKKNKKYF